MNGMNWAGSLQEKGFGNSTGIGKCIGGNVCTIIDGVWRKFYELPVTLKSIYMQ